jgi:glucan phosphoethanolaminetransferase (alkaline phosphatase superfamily)
MNLTILDIISLGILIICLATVMVLLLNMKTIFAKIFCCWPFIFDITDKDHELQLLQYNERRKECYFMTLKIILTVIAISLVTILMIYKIINPETGIAVISGIGGFSLASGIKSVNVFKSSNNEDKGNDENKNKENERK